MRGDPPSATLDMPGLRISQHAKLVIVDGSTSIVTSHNLDPRSEFYNTDNGILVRGAALVFWIQGPVGGSEHPRVPWAFGPGGAIGWVAGF